jgi:hypothetical protein
MIGLWLEQERLLKCSHSKIKKNKISFFAGIPKKGTLLSRKRNILTVKGVFL